MDWKNRKVWSRVGHRHRVPSGRRAEFHPEMPTGPMNRVADNTLARKLLGGCEPEVKFVEGLRRTIDWYFATHEHEAVAKGLERRLIERS